MLKSLLSLLMKSVDVKVTLLGDILSISIYWGNVRVFQTQIDLIPGYENAQSLYKGLSKAKERKDA